MINHVRPRMACTGAILVVALAHCGCQSMKGPSSWMASSKPRANEKETIRYIGQKDKPKANPDDLRAKLANAKEGSKSSNFDTHLRNGNQALRNNQLAEAKKEYEKALALKPNDPDCHHRLAVVADKEGLFGAAADHYDAALKERPNDPNLLSDMGYSYSLQNQDRRAEEILNRALKASPTHKGAMANLGAIYARQNRYEDAMAMFSRGASEAEAQQYMAQLFPQRGGPAAGSAPDNRMLAQNNPDPRSGGAPQNRDQLLEDMRRARSEGRAQRQQQLNDEARPRREWYAQDQQNAQAYQQPPSQSGQPIVLGPNSGQQPSQFNQGNPNQFPIVTPNTGNGNSMASNDGFGQNPNGSAAAGSLNARPGTTPDINEWGGAGVSDPNFQRTAGQRTANANPAVTNTPYYQESPNGGGGQFNSRPPASIQLPNNLQASGGSDVNPASYNDASAANQAAAQMGMNIGGLFPVVPADPSGGAYGQSNQLTPRGVDSRMGHEFQSTPSYQNPNQFQPSNNGFGPGDQRQGFNQSANQFDGGQLGPASPASGWPQIHGQVTQAGAVMPNNPSVPSFGGDPMDRSPTASTWADKPNLGGAAPYNGSWPQGAGSSAPAANPNNGNNIPNSLPNWNGGQATRPQPKQIGPAAYPSGNGPEPWPYRPQ